MKQKLLGRLAAAAVLLLSATTATAHDFEVDGIYYNFNPDGLTVSVTYKGDIWSNDNDYSGTITIPPSLVCSDKFYTVTSIGDYAFYDCKSLSSVNIPNSVTTIGIEAFCGCSSLFDVVLPNSLTLISDKTFWGCICLKSIDIPKSVTSIGNEAFAYCSSLSKIEIPDSVTYIGNEAFNWCSNLSNVKLPCSLNSINDYTFNGCGNLVSIEIPVSVTSIGACAFRQCCKLNSIEIPNSIIHIGESAFNECSGLESIKVCTENTVYDSRDNCNALIETATNTLLKGCKNTIIPDAISSISNFAFSCCDGMSSIEIPSSVTTIGKYAFYGCNNLKSVHIPNSVTKIGKCAYYGCNGLTMVDIPNSVTQIGEAAFSYCENLSLVLFNASKCSNEPESSHIIYGSPVRTLVIGTGVEQLPNSLLSKDYKTCNIVSLAQTPPLLYENTFSSPYNNNKIFTVYVPSDMYVNYWTDDIWGEMQIKEISIPVTDIVLSNEEMNIGTKSTVLLTAIMTPSNATIKDLYWSSSNPQIASVDVYGNITGINNGEAFIFASAIDGSGVIAKCKVTVNNLVAESLELDPSELLLSVNKTSVVTPIYSPEGISNKEFEWSCSNEDVAKFRNNSDGSITVIGVSDGEAIITCHTTDGSNLTATCDVTVSTGTGVENTKSTAAKVRGENGVIRIEGAEDAKVEVFNAAGVCIYSGTATEIPVPQRGLYVVKVAGRATKIAL